MFPRIDSPCPLKSIQLPATGNFNCSACSREVHDLTHLSESERRIFLAGCEGSICVSYKFPTDLKRIKKAALAGVFVMAANGLAIPAAAESQGVAPAPSANASIFSDELEDVILMGGIDNPKSHSLEKVSRHTAAAGNSLEFIPVVEEDDSPDRI